MTTLIKSGTIVTASRTYQADIWIEGEKIKAIGQDFNVGDAEIIDATHKLIMPGGVDPHTHFDLPMFGTICSDNHYTGHKAAAFGGTTTVMDFVPMLEHGNLRAGIKAWKEKAGELAAIDYGFHANISRWDERIAAEVPQLLDDGISSVKVFMAYNQRYRLSDGEIFQLLRIANGLGILTMLHAENGDVIELLVAEAIANGHCTPIWHARTRPAWGAVEATFRGAMLAAQADSLIYIVHVNCAGEVDQIQYARDHGIRVMAETCPQYLFFDQSKLEEKDGAKWVCSPPLRTKNDQARIWRGLQEGTLQVIGTDHCPFFLDGSKEIPYEGQSVKIPGKELGKADFTKIPNGLPVVGDRLAVIWSYGVNRGIIDQNQFVALVSTNPAKIFGLYPQKGAILPGSDADLVVWDSDRKVNYGVNISHHRTDYNLFEGWELTGFPEKVLLRGRVIVDQGQWLGNPGAGKFVYRTRKNEFV